MFPPDKVFIRSSGWNAAGTSRELGTWLARQLSCQPFFPPVRTRSNRVLNVFVSALISTSLPALGIEHYSWVGISVRCSACDKLLLGQPWQLTCPLCHWVCWRLISFPFFLLTCVLIIRYLCDYTYYTSLHDYMSPAVFVHVPLLDHPYSAYQMAIALRSFIQGCFSWSSSTAAKSVQFST